MLSDRSSVATLMQQVYERTSPEHRTFRQSQSVRDSLAQGPAKADLHFGHAAAPFHDALRRLPGVIAVAADGTRLDVTVSDPARDTPLVVKELVSVGAAVLAVRPLAPTLEEVYLRAVREHAA